MGHGNNTENKRGHKSEFILKYPKLIPSELVVLGRENGIDLTEKYIYKVRYDNKVAKATNGAKNVSRKTPKNHVSKKVSETPVSKASSMSDTEREFCSLVVDIGFAQSTAILAKLRLALQSISV